ncbi:MAG TPA: hypothetical protein VFV75_01820 [Candidatus Polarisedimenticolaceae bacterium]|nr:hypothetical protein [Candidatus Polarisedimenticolaceae bacterium]
MRGGSLLLISFLVPVPSLAWDPPDSQLDSTSGLIHTVDSAPSGSDQVIRHTVDPGVGQATVSAITSGHADYSPHLAIGGDMLRVVWQRDLAADQIRTVTVDRHGTLGTEWLLSDVSEDSRNPDIAVFGSLSYVAYEVHGEAAVALAVQTIIDDPDPIGPRIVVGTTTYSGEADVRIHAADGHLWTTWMHAADVLGYAIFDVATQTWGTTAYEPIVGGDVVTALKNVEGTVLGP